MIERLYRILASHSVSSTHERREFLRRYAQIYAARRYKKVRSWKVEQRIKNELAKLMMPHPVSQWHHDEYFPPQFGMEMPFAFRRKPRKLLNTWQILHSIMKEHK